MATVCDQYQSQVNKYITGFNMAFIIIEQIKEQMSSLADTCTSYVVSERPLSHLFVRFCPKL